MSKRRTFVPIIEILELRRLLALSVATADYFPTAPGTNWTESGSYEGDSGVVVKTTVARAKLGSTAVSRFDEETTLPDGTRLSGSSFFRLDKTGLNLFHATSAGLDTTVNLDFKSPLLYLPPILTDSLTGSREVQASAVITGKDMDFRGAGTAKSSIRIFGKMNVTLDDGRIIPDAIGVAVDITFNFLGILNGEEARLKGSMAQHMFLARNLGPVQSQDEVKLTLFQGDRQSAPQTVRALLKMVDSNLIKPSATVAFANGALTVTGTGGADDIAVLLRDEKVLVTSGAFLDQQHVNRANVVKTISVSGGAGNDWISIDTGLQGTQFYKGPSLANAYADAGLGDDTLLAMLGNDTLTGGAGKDSLDGGAGDDRLNGNGGHDYVLGNAGNDRLYGGDGNDALEGGAGVDRIWAGAGADVLAGNGSNDRLFGEAGEDLLIGHQGADLLDGGSESDKATSDATDTLLSIP
jgi:Ca2+-binding RTX toxin-like protein